MSESLRIALLDDSKSFARVAGKQLEAMGFTVRTATSLVEFDVLVKFFVPHVIITDVEMPDIAGDEICRVLRKQHHTAKIPILLVSGLDEVELAERAKRADADGYVCKQAGPDALRERIREVASQFIF